MLASSALAGTTVGPNALAVTADDFLPYDARVVRLGQLLFYDPILSGNRNISCATCHNPDFGTGDGLSLGWGEGGAGVGPDRTAGDGAARIRKRVPRNAPGLWNLGAKEVRVLFDDGRVSLSDTYGNRFSTPAGFDLPDDIESVLSAQTLFPITAEFEMAGNPGENQVAGAINVDIERAWETLAVRVRALPEYGAMFVAAFDDVKTPPDITISHIANAIGQFENAEWQSHDSPYDKWLSGDEMALTVAQRRGRQLFFGKANCATCHSGKFLSDQDFHALALPQFGPGRTRRFDPSVRDVGRMAKSDRLADAYRFRTPSLRNVALTAPYGHDGAYPTLQGIILHHLDPAAALAGWNPALAALPKAPWLASSDFAIFDDSREMQRLAVKIDIAPITLSDGDIADLVAFMNALTGTASLKGRLGRPATVPSGLKVD